MTITKKMQLDWLWKIAQLIEENIEAKGCFEVPCEECPFYTGDHSIEHNCQFDSEGYEERKTERINNGHNPW